jgi:hypothetical protein
MLAIPLMFALTSPAVGFNPAASASTPVASPSVESGKVVSSQATASHAPTWLLEEDPRGWTINWSQYTLTVKGLGQASPVGTYAERTRRSRKIALMDAWNLLARAVGAIKVNADFIVADMTAVDDAKRNRLDMGIRDALPVQETRFPDGSTEMSLQMPLLGPDSVASWLGMTATPSISPASGSVTGLVLDARGSGMQPALCTQVLDASGRALTEKPFTALYAHDDGGLQGWVGDRPRILKVKVARGITRASALLAAPETENWKATWRTGMPVVIVL